MEELLTWLLDMPAGQRQAIIASAKKLARKTGTPVVAPLLYLFQNRDQIRTRSLGR